MKHYQIRIASKNKKSLEDFLLFFLKNFKNSNKIFKYFQKKKKRKILTLLKSPHVNKKAQEQFQSDIFHTDINLYLPQSLQALIIIKKIKINLFLDVNLKIKFPINKNLPEKIQKQLFNPGNFKINFLNRTNQINKLKKTIELTNYKNTFLLNSQRIKLQTQNKNESLELMNQFFKILDIYGEFCKKQ